MQVDFCSSLFREYAKIRQTLPCYKPLVIDGIGDVPSEMEAKMVAVWSEYLVGFFVRSQFPFKIIQVAVEMLWKTNMKSMASYQDFFFFRLNSGMNDKQQ